MEESPMRLALEPIAELVNETLATLRASANASASVGRQSQAGHRQSLAHHQADDQAGRGAQSHPHADLLGASCATE